MKVFVSVSAEPELQTEDLDKMKDLDCLETCFDPG